MNGLVTTQGAAKFFAGKGDDPVEMPRLGPQFGSIAIERRVTRGQENRNAGTAIDGTGLWIAVDFETLGNLVETRQDLTCTLRQSEAVKRSATEACLQQICQIVIDDNPTFKSAPKKPTLPCQVDMGTVRPNPNPAAGQFFREIRGHTTFGIKYEAYEFALSNHFSGHDTPSPVAIVDGVVRLES